MACPGRVDTLPTEGSDFSTAEGWVLPRLDVPFTPPDSMIMAARTDGNPEGGGASESVCKITFTKGVPALETGTAWTAGDLMAERTARSAIERVVCMTAEEAKEVCFIAFFFFCSFGCLFVFFVCLCDGDDKY